MFSNAIGVVLFVPYKAKMTQNYWTNAFGIQKAEQRQLELGKALMQTDIKISQLMWRAHKWTQYYVWMLIDW